MIPRFCWLAMVNIALVIGCMPGSTFGQESEGDLPGTGGEPGMCWFDAGSIRCTDAVVVLAIGGELDGEVGGVRTEEILLSCGECTAVEVQVEEPMKHLHPTTSALPREMSCF